MRKYRKRRKGQQRNALSKVLLFLIVFVIGGFFDISLQVFAEEMDDGDEEYTIRINEVQFTGGPGKTKQDFVELYNYGDDVIDIGDWRLRKQTNSGKEYSLRVFNEEIELDPGDYYVWANSSDSFGEEIDADSQSTATLSEENTVLLQDSEENEVDSVEVPKSDAFAIALDEKGEWQEVFIATPGKKNVFEEEKNISETTLRFSEVFPDPTLVNDSEGEFIEVENYGSEKIDLSVWMIIRENQDKQEEKERKILSGTIESGEFVTFDHVTLPNSDGGIFKLAHISGVVVDELEYKEAIPGKPYAFDGQKWMWACGETPGEKNNFSGYDGETTLRLNEIFPQKSDKYDEYIELYNYGEKKIDLLGWEIRDESKSFVLKEGYKTLAPKDFLILPKEETKIALNNDEDSVFLFDPCLEKRDAFSYKKSFDVKNWSFDGDAWKETPHFTPKEENVFPQKVGNPTVRINEVLPNPSGDEEKDEYIELYNFADHIQDISYWTIEDGSGRTYLFPQETQIQPQEYFVVYRKDFSFALNNSQEKVILRDARAFVIDTMEYGTSKEDVSWNNDEGEWRKSKHLTPGKENKHNNTPRIVDFDVPEDTHKDVKAFFYVRVEDSDDDEISYRWDFGDGHRSYKEDTTHTYEEKDDFTLILTVGDGIEEVAKTREIEVKKYPRHDVSLRSFIPNPIGKDVDNEWIEICNNEEKEVDLRNWSIATGKDKRNISNHPFRQRVELKPGECKKITRDISAFSLNNTQGTLELRSADGSVIERVSYEKENIQEGEVYKKENGMWLWKTFEFQEGTARTSYVVEEDEVLEKYVLGVTSVQYDVPPRVKHFFYSLFESEMYRPFGVSFISQREERFFFTRKGILPKKVWWKRCLWGTCQG
jgi:hypothetical protein